LDDPIAFGVLVLSTIFPKWVNRLPLIIVISTTVGAVGVVAIVWYYFSPRYTDVGYRPAQPVPYSHKLHAGILGMDCRYCHVGVEESPRATIPPTQTCMGCHASIRRDSPRLAPVMSSWAEDKPIPWVRIHDLPDYVHFDHSVHIHAGVGCVSCHGRVDQMEVVHQVEPLSMGWCLECHRNPDRHLRPRDQVTNMEYAVDPAEGTLLKEERAIRAPENCSACHY
jgi:hypothetical protein